MKSLEAFAMGEAARLAGNKQRVFDWDKAARLIVEHKPSVARAGLSQDWEWTGGDIYVDGKPDTESYTYLSSNWAIPELDLDGEIIECWRYEDETAGWGSDTKWPASALAILNGETSK